MTQAQKRQAIINLLRLYRELQQGHGESSSPARHNESRILYDYGGSWDTTGCDDLDRLLGELRETHRGDWWHLTERYIRCEVRPLTLKTRKDRHGQKKPITNPNQETLSHAGHNDTYVTEQWMQAVSPTRVEQGLQWLAARFPFHKYKWSQLLDQAS